MDKPRVVVCAALRLDIYDDCAPFEICGPRHYDAVMRMQIMGSDLDWSTAEQGFIDQFGEFMTREEAYEVAKAAGQIKYRCGGDEGRLFSENLY